MRERLTEDDIAPVVDYIVSESYGSYYYDRVRNSFNVMVLERYLKLIPLDNYKTTKPVSPCG